MKKPSINLNSESIKQFFMDHGEKVGLGVAVLLSLLVIFGGIKRETLPADRSKEALESLGTQVASHIESGSPPVPAPVVPVLQVPDVALLTRSSVRIAAPWNPPAKEERQKRASPAVLTLKSLQGFSGRGAFALKGAGGPAAVPAPAAAAAPPRAANALLGGLQAAAPAAAPVPVAAPTSNVIAQGRHYIIMTGIVPTADQQKEFDARFEFALHPTTNDEPQGHTETNKIDRFHPQYYLYGVQRREVLPNGKFGPETPLDLRAIWTDRSAWSTSMHQELANPDYVDTRLTFPLPPLLLKKWDMRVSHPAVPPKVEAAAAVTAEATPGGDVFDPLAPAVVKKAVDPATSGAKSVPFKLFRFWDYSVEPGKSYQYRVQLILHNPNYLLPERLLEAPALAKEAYLTSPWGEWTETIIVPRDQAILAKSVEFDKEKRKEPYANVVCWIWDNKDAVEVHKEFKLYRGDRVDFTVDSDFNVPGPTGGQLNLKGFVFDLGMMLLDFRGGNQTHKEVANPPPCELVFLDGNSNQLTIRHEVFDQEAIEALEGEHPTTGTPANTPAPASGGLLGGAAQHGPPKGPPGTLNPNNLLVPPTNPEKAIEKKPGTTRPKSQ